MKRIFTILATLGAVGVMSLQANLSPYISKVYEYMPAPGQFVNELPEYFEGDTAEDIISKVEEQICGDRQPGMISLGAYGGYVVFGFDHSIVNVADAYDFKIYGNAFIGSQIAGGGNCEPGIVMVSVDANGNGVPDDEWYELAGSDYNKETTKKNYEIVYYKPDPNKEATPDPDYKFVIDTSYIRYTTNYADEPEGYVKKNSFHPQSYWPEWYEGETIRYIGTKLADNYVDQGGAGSYYVQHFLEWGYADNLPNDQYDGFKIDWAVDSDGNPVSLEKVDFIKVYTGVNQYCGWIGETSTEICGAEDLHPEAQLNSIDVVVREMNEVTLLANNSSLMALRNAGEPLKASIYTLHGGVVMQMELMCGDNTIDISALPKGVYLLKAGNKSIKFLK